MRITKVRIKPVDGDAVLKAYVTIKIEDSFLIRDVKVIKGSSGLFVSMPARKLKNGSYQDIAHPLDKQSRQALEDAVMAEYRRVTGVAA